MHLVTQIFLGSVLLTFCALIHITLVAVVVPCFAHLARALSGYRGVWRNAIMLGFGVFVTVFAHTVQIWSWAFSLNGLSAFDDFATAFYFAIATYTTLGYGDLILGPEHRVFASFASITGLLTFGLSTAFLIGLATRLLELDDLPVRKRE